MPESDWNFLFAPVFFGLGGPSSPARTFFVGAGVAILVVWLLPRYRESPQA
jgi:hypothetical protein